MKWFKLAVLAVLAHTATPVSAYDFEVDGVYYNVVSLPDLTAEITHGSSDEKYSFESFSIPTEVTYKGRTFAIVRIGGGAFWGCSRLASVTIPNSVTSIEWGAFQNCSGLASITIPNSVTNIGGGAFSGCSRLASVTIPNSVTSIEYSVFWYCESLTSVTIPSSVTSIGERAFCNCTSLISVALPDNLTSIGEQAFSGCSSITSVTIPEKVTVIGKRAFEKCTSLDSISIHSNTLTTEDTEENGHNENIVFSDVNVKHIYISSNVSSIGDFIFDFKSTKHGLKEVTIADGEIPLYLGCGGFASISGTYYCCNGCFSSMLLEKVYLGRDLSYEKFDGSYQWWGTKRYKKYNDEPFKIPYDSNIKEIHVGDYVTNIEGLCLPDHKALEKMTIGKRLPEVPDLSKYSSLTSLTLNSEVPQKASDFSTAQYMHLNVYIPKGSLAAYQSADVWKNFWNLQEIETTGVDNAISNASPAKEVKRYDVIGREINGVHKGLNIIRMSDGTTKKVIIK